MMKRWAQVLMIFGLILLLVESAAAMDARIKYITDQKVIVYVSGSVDIPGAQRLKKKAFDKILENDQVREVIIDFEAVNHFGESAIGKLLMFHRHFVRERGGKLLLVYMNKEIHALFLAIKLNKLFDM